MKASKLITLKQRKKLYGEYILLKNLVRKRCADINNMTFEDYLTNVYALPLEILKETI